MKGFEQSSPEEPISSNAKDGEQKSHPSTLNAIDPDSNTAKTRTLAIELLLQMLKNAGLEILRQPLTISLAALGILVTILYTNQGQNIAPSPTPTPTAEIATFTPSPQTPAAIATLPPTATAIITATSTPTESPSPEPRPTPTACERADLDGDEQITATDISLFGSHPSFDTVRGQPNFQERFDYDADGDVDTLDQNMMIEIASDC